MARLEPCPSCQRHLRVDEPICPFCNAKLGNALSTLPQRAMPTARLGRAALFAFGIGAAATASVGCSDEPDPDDDDGEQTADAGARDGGAPPRDAGLDANVAPVYGAPAYDAASPDAAVPDAATADAALEDAGLAVPLYGLAAPPDDAGEPDLGGTFPLYGLAPFPSDKPTS